MSRKRFSREMEDAFERLREKRDAAFKQIRDDYEKTKHKPSAEDAARIAAADAEVKRVEAEVSAPLEVLRAKYQSRIEEAERIRKEKDTLAKAEYDASPWDHPKNPNMVGEIRNKIAWEMWRKKTKAISDEYYTTTNPIWKKLEDEGRPYRDRLDAVKSKRHEIEKPIYEEIYRLDQPFCEKWWADRKKVTSEYLKARAAIRPPTIVDPEHVEAIARRKAIRETPHTLKIGDILEDRHAFYQVVNITKHSVKIRRLNSRKISGDELSGKYMPIKDDFNGEPEQRRADGKNRVTNDYSWMSIWDGSPRTVYYND